jgi:hypothetical protein
MIRFPLRHIPTKQRCFFNPSSEFADINNFFVEILIVESIVIHTIWVMVS